jgi:hypothetical protein
MAAKQKHPYGFNVNMKNLVQTGLLNKMIPLLEDLGDAWGPPWIRD